MLLMSVNLMQLKRSDRPVVKAIMSLSLSFCCWAKYNNSSYLLTPRNRREWRLFVISKFTHWLTTIEQKNPV